MKQTLFKCPVTDEAIDALGMHTKSNPDGVPLYSGRSRRKTYYGYVVYETKTKVIVEELK
ncbi:MAG: hypothetical protein ABJG42_24620 [Vibrio splendidus]